MREGLERNQDEGRVLRDGTRDDLHSALVLSGWYGGPALHDIRGRTHTSTTYVSEGCQVVLDHLDSSVPFSIGP